MKISVRAFQGISPFTRPRYLQDSQAQIALNCKAWLGPLQAIKAPVLVADLPKAGAHTTIYRFGENETDESNYWFHWNADVDVVKGLINDDTSERTFYSGDGKPKVTDNTLALLGGDGQYPSNFRTLGVPAPTLPITSISKSGTAETGGREEERVYTYTYVNSWGEESVPYVEDPMPGSMIVQHVTGESIVLGNIPAHPGGAEYDITHKRIYRSVRGTGTTIYQYVAQITNGQTSFTDNVDADDLQNEMTSLDYDHPPEGLKGFVALANGVIAGFLEKDIYFSEPYRPFAFPQKYSLSVSDKIVGLATIDTTVAVLTQGKPKLFQGSHPEYMVEVKSLADQACVSKRSIVVIDGIVHYASPDGLVGLTTGGSTIITAGMFGQDDWLALKPESMHGYEHDGRYIGFYDNGVTQGGFIYDRRAQTFQMHDVYASGGYRDLKRDALYLIISNDLYKWDKGAALTFVWRSKLFTMPHDIGFSCFQIEAEGYPITFNLFRDGVLHHSESVNSQAIRRLPAGRGRDWEFEIIGTAEVFGVHIAQSPKELTDV